MISKFFFNRIIKNDKIGFLTFLINVVLKGFCVKIKKMVVLKGLFWFCVKEILRFQNFFLIEFSKNDKIGFSIKMVVLKGFSDFLILRKGNFKISKFFFNRKNQKWKNLFFTFFS